jgi:hypothetical protein
MGCDALAGSPVFRDSTPWQVFVSHTSELRAFPEGMSYVGAVERAISAAGHVIVDMDGFPASAQAPSQVCAERVRGCEVYVGRSSPASRRACTRTRRCHIGTRACPRPEDRLPSAPAGLPAIPFTPAARPGMTHRDGQSMRRRTESTHIA